nr:hypothetical protein [Bacteroidota bacterium]
MNTGIYFLKITTDSNSYQEKILLTP